MLSIIALSAVFAVLAACTPASPAKLKSAFQDQGCAEPGPNNECLASSNGFHFICGEYTWGEAQSVCYSLGYRPAVIPDYETLAALDVVNKCLLLGGRRVWIDSFNGLGADPCAYIVSEGGAVYSPGDQFCASLKLPVLCQEAPVSVVTESVQTTTSIITEGITTALTTTCIQCNCQGKNIDPLKCPSCFVNKNNELQGKADAALKAQERRPHQCHRSSSSSSGSSDCSHQHPPRCLDPQGCQPLCPYTVGGLHVIQANLTFNQAERECNKYGWNLADVYAGLHADVGFMQQMCTTFEQDYNLWIRSYNGVDGGMCVLTLFDDFNNVPIGFGWTADYCMGGPLYVLCQERPPAITGTGAFGGSMTMTSTTYSYGTTYTVPSLTVTSTITNYY